MKCSLLQSSVLGLLSLTLFPSASLLADEPAAPPLRGFSVAAAAEQRALEERFDQVLDAENLREWMRRMTARPHHVGSPHGRANAELMLELFRSWGYDARIETFHVLFPTPKTRVLEMIAPHAYTAQLVEPPVDGDATSAQQEAHLPTYNAYSVDGDVTGELVYVNYGVPDDYEELALRGVDVAGKVVIARYGGSWRGIKPKVAAEHGAIGCIIYSDPGGDGYFQGDVYPKGGWRGPHGVQRGSVLDFSHYGGDPLTPFAGATEDAERRTREEVPVLTRIPTLPISYADAQPLLAALGGHLAPEGWRGTLPIAYHLGPGPATVRLKVEFDWDLAPAHDVIAMLPGAEEPDQWVIRGNHHDGWVFGATDPVSGMVAVLEEARAVAELAKTGWRPRRTIVYAGWDAEEQGLMGSTEWAEAHAAELREKAVAYVNSDSNSRGFYGAGGSHTLERLVNETMRDVADPQLGISVLERARAATVFWGPPEAAEEARERADLRIRPLGSGSDYGPFLQHLGIASLNVSFGDEDEYGQYHSIYDSFDHYVRFMDPDFVYGVALAQTAGRTVLRLANAEILPFEIGAFVDSVGLYVEEIAEMPEAMRKETAEKNRRIADGVFAAVLDPKKTWVVPEPEGEVPYLNTAPLKNALARLEKSAADYAEAYEPVASGERALADDERRELNRILFRTERALTREHGLPGRAWYRHQIYAPGVYTGYAPKTMPSIREAIEQRKWQLAEEQIAVVAETLLAFAAEVDRATGILEGLRRLGAGAEAPGPGVSTRRAPAGAGFTHPA